MYSTASGAAPKLHVVLKCDVAGSTEALGALLQSLGGRHVPVELVRTGLGDLAETDVEAAALSNGALRVVMEASRCL